MDVLATLVDADGGVVERDALLETVWPDVVVGEEVLTHAIDELRPAREGGARSCAGPPGARGVRPGVQCGRAGWSLARSAAVGAGSGRSAESSR